MKKPTLDQVPTFARSYFEALVFTNLPERLCCPGDITEWFDFHAAWHSMTRKDQNALLTDCHNFRNEDETAKPLLDEVDDDARTGADFWFSRNGHGTGFWARDYLDDAKRKTLHAASRPYGEAYADLYRGRWTYHA